jgi:hypothetical protein
MTNLTQKGTKPNKHQGNGKMIHYLLTNFGSKDMAVNVVLSNGANDQRTSDDDPGNKGP